MKAISDALLQEVVKVSQTSVSETWAESSWGLSAGTREEFSYLVDGLLTLLVLLGLLFKLLTLLYVVDEREEVAQVDDERLRLGQRPQHNNVWGINKRGNMCNRSQLGEKGQSQKLKAGSCTAPQNIFSLVQNDRALYSFCTIDRVNVIFN